MHKLFPCSNSKTLHGVFDEVLHRFHVVVGDALLVLHPLGVCLVEIAVNVAASFDFVLREIRELREGHGDQRQKIFHFNLHAVVNQSELGHPWGKRSSVATVATVNGRNGV